jgi:hypothetical protein
LRRADAREVLEEIRAGKRLCWTSGHFEEEALAEGFSMNDIWFLLRRYRFTEDPEDRGNSMWRVRLDGRVLDGRRARLVLDLSRQQTCIYVTIHSLAG